MNGQSVVDEIKKLCFGRGASIGDDPHTEFTTSLAYLLRTLGYRVEREYPVSFNHLTLRTRSVRREHGFIDLFAERGTDLYGRGERNTIAIEYDNGRSLKYKSIEKLLQCKADTLIGIVSNGFLNHNKERIHEVMSGRGITNKKLLLIAVGENTFEEVRWQM